MKILKIILVIICYLPASFLFAQNLNGKVSDISTHQKLMGAYIRLQNDRKKFLKTTTNENGEFSFGNLVPGEYKITVEYIGFTPYTASVKVNEGTMKLNIELSEKATTLNGINVSTKINGENEIASRLQEKNSTSIINVVSSQQMERSPDMNAANVLQRVSGVTIQRNSGADEAYSIIRGLEPRYSNTLINGIKITSPDDKSRFVSLNLISSDLLQKIEVSKTLLPEMEGDAIGGTVNLVMKDAPAKTTFRMLGGVGYSLLFFNRKYVNFSKKDIQQKSIYDRFGSSYIAQPGDFSRSNLDFKDKNFTPTGMFGFVFGKRFLKDKLGILVAESFQNQYYGTQSIFNQVVPDTYLAIPVYSDYSNRTFSTQQLNNGVTAHIDYVINSKNKIIINNFLLYNYLAQTRVIIDTAILGGNGGRTIPGTGPITNDYTATTTHQFLENVKIEGQHILLTNLIFDWAGIYSLATSRSPDRADLSINTKIDTVQTPSSSTGYIFTKTPYYFDDITRIWQHNHDQDFSGIANILYKIPFKSNSTILNLKAGVLYRHKTRYNIQNEYDLKPTTNSGGIKQPFYDIYSAQWVVYDTHGTQQYDINNYKLYEDVTAGYIQAKFNIRQFEFAGGVRVESTKQGYALNTFYSTGINAVNKTYTDALPGFTVKYSLNKKSALKFAYFKSIARPNYYELVPALRYSTSSADATQGNPYLEHTVANNYDARYETFSDRNSEFFVGAFLKQLQNPIEYAYINGTTYKPVNSPNATVYGGELVYSKYFGKFGISANYTYLYSTIKSIKSYTDLTQKITYDSLQERPLQGETNNTLNISLLYRSLSKGLFVQLVYQYLGKTLALVYPIYGFDYYQRPQSFLALSVEKQIKKRFVLFGKFNNLLNTATVNKINTLLTVKDTYNANFMIGIRYSN